MTFFGSSLAIIYAYNASNTSGHTKKVTVNAMTLASYCIGNIIGAETFLPKDAPSYIPGKTAILILLSVSFFLCIVIRWINIRLNQKKKRLIREMKEMNSWSDEDVERERQRHAFLDMTDKEYAYHPSSLNPHRSETVLITETHILSIHPDAYRIVLATNIAWSPPRT